jgi:hypothetical protein
MINFKVEVMMKTTLQLLEKQLATRQRRGANADNEEHHEETQTDEVQGRDKDVSVGLSEFVGFCRVMAVLTT